MLSHAGPEFADTEAGFLCWVQLGGVHVVQLEAWHSKYAACISDQKQPAAFTQIGHGPD